ncbi:dihydroorotase [Treponema porcinum]|uniref:dihydroorotase n=1 Tax=Treponema porcinum TaxID=261392 RepID=UPI0023F38E82|nr:dihydroorotase [Treponema porcinum]MDD7126709.1 dihydroorotase [Treponema porcinum]MDY4467109.1 dihydroorotase [Treponema porcinum]MDY5454805.1 dihydroorotase [Treponema porcinum]
MNHALFIYNAAILDESIDGPGAVLIVEGKIRSVFQGYFTGAETVKSLAAAILAEDGYENNYTISYLDAKGLTVTPAFIDMHVHFRDPGFTQKEDLLSGLRAASAGGYGTVVAMPNTKPVISSAEQALEVNRRAAEIGLGTVIQSVSITRDFAGTDTAHLDELDRHSVPLITEDGHDVASSAVMLEAMTKASEKGIIVSCHSEDCSLAAAARPHRERALEIMRQYSLPAWGGNSEAEDVPEEALEEIEDEIAEANALLALAENVATSRNIEIARQAGCHVHICHISTAEAIDSVRDAKEFLRDEAADFYADMAVSAYDASLESRPFVPLPPAENGFSVTCEATPHHIALCGTDEPYIRAFVNPPLRTEEDRIVLLEAIRDGTVDVIATDHAPHTLEDKANGAPGFTGIETAYGICNSVLVKEGQISAKRLSQLMSANPARILGLNKGLLKSGYDADIALVDPDERWTVDSGEFFSKGKASPFDGSILTGKVKALFTAGRKIFG